MSNPPRRFTLFDAMAMVAATAVGIAGSVRIWNSEFYNSASFLEFSISFLTSSDAVIVFIGHYCYLLSPCAFTWTLTVSLLILKRPRPPMRRIASQPGVIACWAASLALVVTNCLELLNAAMHYPHWLEQSDFLLDHILDPAFRPVGCAVLSAWAVAGIAGRWRPEPSWIDRLGRFLGVIWIVGMPFTILYWWD